MVRKARIDCPSCFSSGADVDEEMTPCGPGAGTFKIPRPSSSFGVTTASSAINTTLTDGGTGDISPVWQLPRKKESRSVLLTQSAPRMRMRGADCVSSTERDSFFRGSCQTGEMSPVPPSVRVVLIALLAVVTPKLLDGRGILNVPAPGPHGVISSSTSAPLEKHDGQSIRALRTIVG